MEDERKWEKVRIEKEIRGDLARLKMISSLYAVNLIGKVELVVMMQREINWLSLVAVVADLVYQYQKEIIYEDCQVEISQKDFIKAAKEMDRLSLIKVIMKILEDRKREYWKQKTMQRNTTHRGKTNVSSFFCLKFQEMVE